MTTEEKAKAYDEALDRMKHVVVVPENEKALQALKETIFPELQESEGERIRKELIQFFSDKDEEDYEGLHKRTEIVSWLEKGISYESKRSTRKIMVVRRCCMAY